MKIWSAIRRLNFWQLVRLSGLALQKPLYMLPTLRATRKTIHLCNALYANEHHGQGKANAFRHALWNVLICRAIFILTKSLEKAIFWAQKVTNLHEKLTPNEPLETAMDLHNNYIGRSYFKLLKDHSEDEISHFLVEKTQNAKEISDIKSIATHKNDLVYLSLK